MKKLMLFLLCIIGLCLPAFAQCPLNDNADAIVGEYLTDRGGSKSKVRVTKEADGTYTACVFWVENPYDAQGQKRKDVKNPDKQLRNVDIDNVVIFKGLKYDKKNKEWTDTKIYDPSKGKHFSLTARFESENRLKLSASFLKITIYWQKLK